MLNLVAISQSAPGPVAVNASILVGYRLAGFPGAVFSLLGTILPPLIILTVISLFYQAFQSNPVVAAVLKGMQAGVAAVIADVVVGMGLNVARGRDVLSIAVMAGAFVASYFFQVNVMLVILLCGLLGAARTLVRLRRERRTVK